MNYQYVNQLNRKKANGVTATVIKYEEGSSSPPKVVASGTGHVANKIIAMAKENDIPMQEDPSLIQNLLDLDLGENIPPQLYAVIAEILLLIQEMEKLD